MTTLSLAEFKTYLLWLILIIISVRESPRITSDIGRLVSQWRVGANDKISSDTYRGARNSLCPHSRQRLGICLTKLTDDGQLNFHVDQWNIRNEPGNDEQGGVEEADIWIFDNRAYHQKDGYTEYDHRDYQRHLNEKEKRNQSVS